MPSPKRRERDENPGAARVINPLYRERLFALIDGAPFVRHMGMRITDLAWGRASFEMTPAEFRLQPFGVVHGGNIATLIRRAVRDEPPVVGSQHRLRRKTTSFQP
jgi:hypothetical protein